MYSVGFKFNTYQEFLQESKKKKDDNIDPFQLEIEDTPYSDEQAQYADMATKFIFNKVKEEFDAVTVGIWRLRYMVTVNRTRNELQEDKTINWY